MLKQLSDLQYEIRFHKLLRQVAIIAPRLSSGAARMHTSADRPLIAL